MGKGSNPRPIDIPKQDYRDNWDRIFSKKKPDEPPKPPHKTPDAK
jgi:hypothetical protein